MLKIYIYSVRDFLLCTDNTPRVRIVIKGCPIVLADVRITAIGSIVFFVLGDIDINPDTKLTTTEEDKRQ